jgi:hypothetical protein
LDLDDSEFNPDEDHTDVPIQQLVHKILGLDMPGLQDVDGALCVEPHSVAADTNGSFKAKSNVEEIWEVDEMEIAAGDELQQEQMSVNEEEDAEDFDNSADSSEDYFESEEE